VLSLSDQQLVTGLALLIAAFHLDSQGKISIYHFTFVNDLVLLGSNVHFSSLIVLRKWVRTSSEENGGEDGNLPKSLLERRSPVALWRALCMLVTLVLLLRWRQRRLSRVEYEDSPGACPSRCIQADKPNALEVYVMIFIASGFTNAILYTLSMDEAVRSWLLRHRGAIATAEGTLSGVLGGAIVLTLKRVLLFFFELLWSVRL